jgi:hypothetical protein
MFLTKAWGFSIPCGPLQFGMSGWRDRARTLLTAGDLVIVVGTKETPTPIEEQGRVLGIMEPTNEPVMSLDFPLETFAHDFDEGQYKWPFALINRRAWTLLDRPLLESISSRRFNVNAAAGIVALNDDEAKRILQLRRQEVELLMPINVLARLEGYEAARRRNAPPPATTRSGVMHVRRAPAYTYAMEIQGASSSAFKIGWAFDYGARMRQFNLYALPQIGGLSYRVRLFQFWATARQAFKMEQEVLRRFDAQRHPANREVIYDVGYSKLQSAWGACVLTLRRSHQA